MYIKNIYMAPPVAYERQACLHHACKNTTRLLCSEVSKHIIEHTLYDDSDINRELRCLFTRTSVTPAVYNIDT